MFRTRGASTTASIAVGTNCRVSRHFPPGSIRLCLVGRRDWSSTSASPFGGASGDSSRWRILHGQNLRAADSRIRRSPCLRDGVEDRLAVGWVTKDAGRRRLVPRRIGLGDIERAVSAEPIYPCLQYRRPSRATIHRYIRRNGKVDSLPSLSNGSRGQIRSPRFIPSATSLRFFETR